MNQQDPLAQLRDIHLPNTVGFWPPAPGWWLLAALVLAAIIVGIVFAVRHFRANAYRRRALAELDGLWKSFLQQQDCQTYLNALTQLLRRTAIKAFPQSQAATLHGAGWLQFLDETAPTCCFGDGPGQWLTTLPYQSGDTQQSQPMATYSALQHCVSDWVKRHRPAAKLSNQVEMRHAAL